MKSKLKQHLAAMVVILGGVASVPAGTITDGMIVHLSFDTDYANTAPGSAVTAAPVGAPTIEAGQIGSGAVHVSNAADGSFFNYVTLGTPAELNFGGSTDFSVSTWIKVNSTTGDPAFLSNKDWLSGGNPGFVVFVGGGGNFAWNFKESSSGRVDVGGPALNDGNWHHVAVSYDRDGSALTFFDGVLTSRTPIGPAEETIDSGLPTNIGQDGTGTYTSGGSVSIDALMDDVTIWNRAIDAADARGLYDAGISGLNALAVPDPAHPVLLTFSPGNNEIDVKTDRSIVATIRDGVLPLDAGTVSMTLNGAPASVVQTRNGIYTTIEHVPAVPLNNKTVYNVELVYGDSTLLATNSSQFTTVARDQQPAIVGHWDFDSGDLSASIGAALEFMGGPGGATANNTQFGTTKSFGIPDINGAPAKVMRFPGATNDPAFPGIDRRTIGYIMRHGAVPNGPNTATKVNNWTMIMDVMITQSAWFSFIQIDNLDNGNDGELFVNPGGGIGISGQYPGLVSPFNWHRVVFACDMSSDTPVISKFIDGINVADQGRTAPQVDGRHSLQSTALLFADEDGESQVAFVNSIQVRNYKMSDTGVAALGGPSAEGIPLVSGQWDFEDVNAGLKATIGSDLAFRPDTEFVTEFTTSFMDDGVANVMNFNYVAGDPGLNGLGYVLPHGILPNGGGEFVNQYTLIMDILFPATSTGFRSLFQTDTNNLNDGDIFLNGGSGLGISGQYQGNVAADVWHRVAVTVDLTKREMGKYIDGVNVLTGPVGSAPLGTGPFQYLSATDGVVDKRWSLSPVALLFADEDGELAAGVVNSIQTRPVILSSAEIARLGKPTATGIPAVIPSVPTLTIGIGDFGTVVISWPANVTGYILESSPALGDGAVWTTIVDVFNNTYEEFREPTTPFFYRMRKAD